jgi:hypothetical protein
MLDRLNRAKRIYSSSHIDEQQRQEADVTFADSFDWLVEHEVPFHYDGDIDLWLYSGVPVVYS